MNKQNLREVHGYGLGLLFEISKCGDAIRIGGKKPRWQEIKFDNNGEPYCTHYRRKILLSLILRVED
jgi:hypothetical protein